MTKQAQHVVTAALALGILMPVGAEAVTLEGAVSAASGIVAHSQRERVRRPRTDRELLQEADDKDYIATLPPPTEKEWCELGGLHVFVISPKTGRKYCIPAFTERGGGGGEGRGEREKTKQEIEQEVAANDSFPDSPPPTEKEWCELGGNHLFVVSPKTGNKYCITSTTERGGGERGGGERPKTQWEIDREVETLDYFAQNPPRDDRTPKEQCEAFGDKKYVISSKGKAYCLDAFIDD